MLISEDFQFSQASLQDYEECPRRFYLRYVMNAAWPAVITEPAEEHERQLRLGQDFHRLVQQQLLGLPEERLAEMIHDPELELWWQAYRTYRPAELSGAHYPEMSLGATVAGHRLVAKYDLVVMQPEDAITPGTWRATIFDWKTSPKPARADVLISRWQTRVYRYLLAAAGAHLNGGAALAPEQIGMLYWYPAEPAAVRSLPYTSDAYAADGRELAVLLERIAGSDEPEAFWLTDDLKRCGYCPYRSHCGRGEIAASIERMDEIDVGDVSAVEIDFEQIAEIEF